MQSGTVILTDYLAVSYETKHSFTIQPTIAFLDICPNELKTYVHTKACPCMFIAALFMGVPKQNPTKISLSR